jgi:acyl-CoA thioester hydrolase
LPEAELKHQTKLRVRYAETDQMGVVYYANYFVWMEIGRVELVRFLGLDYRRMEQDEGLFLAVMDATCRYRYPARYDQEVMVETKISSANPRVIEFEYEIRLADEDRLLAEGYTKHMWLNREWRPARLPEQYHALLRIG